MTDTSLKLFTDRGFEYEVKGSEDATIPEENFVKAEVLDGKWSLYSEVNFPYNKKVMILEENGKHQLSFSPRSAKILPYKVNALVVFAHPHYTGKSQVYEDADSDITTSFPPKNPGGVSSAIVWPEGNWEVFKVKNMEGGIEYPMPTGKYPNPNDLPCGGDTMQSVRPKQ